VRLPKAFRLSVDEVSIRREGEALVLEPVAVVRDANGWPEAFWQLAGAAPEFDPGARPTRHERQDALDTARSRTPTPRATRRKR
jgi:virulence-associated protein VagC